MNYYQKDSKGMSAVSAASGDNRETGQERHPMDLASKTSLKAGDTVKTVSAQQVLGTHSRASAGTLGHVQSRILSTGISAVGTVPVCVTTTNTQASIKTGLSSLGDQGGGLASVVLMSVPRSGLAAAASASSGSTTIVQSTVSVARSTPSPAVSATTTYHVPRGAAAVANIAAPRPGTTSLGRPTSGATAITHASNLVTGLRGIVPRASSPGTTWLGSVSQSSVSAAARPRAPAVTSMTSYAQPRTPTLAVVTSRPGTPQGTRVQLQTEVMRSQALHANVQKLPTSQNTSGNVGPQLLVTQSRSQQSSTATSVSVSSTTQRILPGATTSSSPTLAVSTSSGTASPRPVQTALLGTGARPSPTISNTRTLNSVSSAGSRAGSGTTGGTTGSATLALAVGTQVRPRLASSGPSRLTTSGSTPRLLTSVRPATVSANANSAAVLPTQSRLGVSGPASVVSLQPVVVTAGTGLPIKSATSRPSLGPKVISQPVHTPASIQITQMPVTAVQATVKVPSTSSTLPQAPSSRTVTYSANTAVVTGAGGGVRPVSVPTSTLAGPVTKVTLHTTTAQPPSAQPTSQQSQTQQNTPSQAQASVCIQHRASPAPSTPNSPLPVEHTTTSVLSTYNIPAYLYEGGGNTYQVTGVVARPFTPAAAGGANGSTNATTTYAVQTSATAVLRPSGVGNSSAPLKFNPVMVVDPSGSSMPLHSSFLQEGALTPNAESATPPPPPPAVNKPSASPRPSILRKRDNEGSPMKAQKNLTPLLSSLSSTAPTTVATTNSGPGMLSGPPVSPPSPRRPDSRGGGGGNSSGGSTTISATSSPGLAEAPEEAAPVAVKQEVGEEPADRPPPEMSPRKKPRKQQLTGNELHEPKFSEDEMEFISEERIKKEIKENRHREPEEAVLHISIPQPEDHVEKALLPPSRRRGLTLLAGYRHNWKSRHNHYVRYSDVRPKDERRPTVSELAAQKQVLQKLDGWKVHHLSTQMEELSELEQQVSERLAGILKLMEKRMGKDLEKDINRINELIKGNIQRSKVASDQMQEAKGQVLKIFEHKNHVADILNRSANKRSLKKREKS